jgi:prepilin-type processing-associated H-X9-DG protein
LRSWLINYGEPAATPPAGGSDAINWRDLIMPYEKSEEVFRCPDNPNGNLKGDSAAIFAMDGANYGGSPHWVSYGANGHPYDCFSGCAGQPAIVAGERPFMPDYAGLGTTALAQIQNPASLIVIGETTMHWPDMPWGADGGGPAPQVFEGHTGRANYVFADGHAKPLYAMQTATPVDMWDIVNNNANKPAYATAITEAQNADKYYKP